MNGGEPTNAVYEPATLKFALLAVLLMAFSLLLIHLGQPAVAACIALRPCAVKAFGAFCAGYLFLFLLLPFMLFNIVMGVPRLTVSDQGAVLQTAFGARRVHWTSLGPFIAVKTRRSTFLQAPVTGRAADDKSIKSGKLVLTPSSFAGDRKGLVDELNAWRRHGLEKIGIIEPRQAAGPAFPHREAFPARRGFSLARAAAMFIWLWLPILFTLVPLVAADAAMLRLTGQHMRNDEMGGLMLLTLAALALGAGWFVGTRLWRPTLTEAALGMAAYLLAAEALLMLPALAPNARIGLAIVALLVPICLSFCLFTTKPAAAGRR